MIENERLKGNPFYLKDDEIEEIYRILRNMSLIEKVGQCFCPMGFGSDDKTIKHVVQECHVGGMMYRIGFKKEIRETHEKIQKYSKIPLLLAANTEAGGNGLLVEGTSFGRPMAAAATGDPVHAYHMGLTACREGACVGMNWSFAPIVDIDLNYHNPITNVRTFGSNVENVISMGKEYIKGAKEAGVATAVKHFPGDGVDERDQHLVTSVNSLSAKEWDATYGRVYKEMIQAGTRTIMVGHIAQPAKAMQADPSLSRQECFMPATVSKALITGVLRRELGFEGMISTDATPMIGYLCAMKRRDALVATINSGIDMILFNKDLDEDIAYVKDAVEKGEIKLERLEDAVLRILALKASLGLLNKSKEELVPKEEYLDQIGTDEHKEWARECADAAITLVKDTQNLLPLSSRKYPRIYLNVIQDDKSPENPIVYQWKNLFEKEGFHVEVRNRTTTIEMENFMGIGMTEEKQKLFAELYRPVGLVGEGRDLYVYIVNLDNGSNNTTRRIDWNVIFGLGDDAPWFVNELPTLMISTANPYHLLDAPMIKTYINSYHSEPIFNELIMDKLMGRSDFNGISPVDPFCGREELLW